MKKQILSAVLISTMLAATLAGCGSKAADPTTAAPAAQTEAAKGEETKAPETEAKAEEPKVDDANLSEVEKIIKEAESMSMEELAKRQSKSPTERPSTELATPAVERPLYRCSSNTYSPSILPIPWNMSCSSRRIIRSSNSCRLTP